MRSIRTAALIVAAAAGAAVVLGTGASDSLWTQQATVAMPSVTLTLGTPTPGPTSPPRSGTAECRLDSLSDIGIIWHILATIEPLSSTYRIELRTPTTRYALPTYSLSGYNYHYRLSDTALISAGWVTSSEPQTVDVIVLNADGDDVDSVTVTLGEGTNGRPVILACTG
ncbi:hypothetical protein [Xylanimonas ulmi]|uniref:Uncharacterized protein n=1 Tax=Xylanimonas ulmi TaxID=228973 RepID=A0A4Q7M5T4_9MICO|nr:hypothetical protein [Xylanibacterium ulmi]RZS62012.1 hypothetical protein EV386_2329 [Xylanibacterium ulmi]